MSESMEKSPGAFDKSQCLLALFAVSPCSLPAKINCFLHIAWACELAASLGFCKLYWARPLIGIACCWQPFTIRSFHSPALKWRLLCLLSLEFKLEISMKVPLLREWGQCSSHPHPSKVHAAEFINVTAMRHMNVKNELWDTFDTPGSRTKLNTLFSVLI